MGQWTIRQVFSFEAVFIAFLYAGFYKRHPTLAWVPVDLTVFFLFITVSVGVLFWFRDEWSITPSVMNILLIYTIFVIYSTLSLSWSDSNIYAQHKLVRLATLVPGAIIGAIVIGQSRDRFNRFLRLSVGVGTVLALLIIIQFFFGDLQRGFRFGEASYLIPSRVVGISTLILVYWLNSAKYPYTRFMLISLISIHMIGVFLSSSRGALISTIAAVGLYVILQSWTNKYRLQITKGTRSLISAIAIGGLGIISGIYTGLIDISSFRIVRRTIRNLSPTRTETAISARMEHYQFAFDLWMQSPIVGHGIGSYGILQTGRDVINYPHNIILEILSELGIIGLFIICLLIGVGMVRMYRYHEFSDQSTISFLITFSFFWFVASLFSFDITGNRYFFMSLAFLYSANNLLLIDDGPVKKGD